MTHRIESRLWRDATPQVRNQADPSESHIRSIAKALSWRVVALLVTFFVVWTVTGKIEFAATAGGADALLKMGLYYLHERGWARSRFGITKKYDIRKAHQGE